MAQCATSYGGSFAATHTDTKLGTHNLHTQQGQLCSKQFRIASVVARESVAMASAMLACHTGLSSSRQSNNRLLLQLGAVSSPSRRGIQVLVSNSADLATTRNPMAFRSLAPVTKSLTQDELKNIAADKTVAKESVSVILLAGGKGTRMGASMPKQYLPLLGQPIALYSFYTFAEMGEVMEIVVVCDPSYRDIFEEAGKNISVPLKFALPGKERQDSVRSGLQKIDKSAKLACVHDSARPLVLVKDIEMVIRDAAVHGAAVLGVPVKATIKEAGSDLFVTRTLDRSLLWEMQTPQVIEPGLLARGFEFVEREGLDVTDDVSIVEHLKHPVFITKGSYTNLKVTTPDDLLVAERILHQTAPQEVVKAVAT